MRKEIPYEKIDIELIKVLNNIDIYEWHRLDSNRNKMKDWILKLEIHPRNEEVNESEKDRVLRIKEYTIKK